MTPERGEYFKRYYSTPRGKEVRAATLKKYNASAKGRAFRKAYQQSGKGRIATKKYTRSYRGILRAALKRCQDRHRVRWPNDPTTLTLAQLIEMWRVQAGRCALSGVTMTWGAGVTLLTSLSIDRIDHGRGYHLTNIRLICQGVNAMRGAGTDDELIAMAKAIVAHANQHDRVSSTGD